MYKRFNAYFLVIALLLLMSGNAVSQVTTSPYSIFGLGCIEGNSTGAASGMGGTGIGLMSRNTINLLNPASYGGLDTLFTIYEIGFSGKYTSYNSSSGDQALFNANAKYVAMSFRIAPRLATSFGILPYSSVGYKINTNSEVKSSNQVFSKTFSGEGGVNKVYLGGSYNLSKNLFVGLNASYLFGTITHSESSESISYSLKDLSYVSNFEINWGLNYRIVKDQWNYNIGLVYDRGKSLRTRNISTITTETEIKELNSYTTDLKIPRTIGIGLAVEKGYFRGGIDFKTQKWSGVDFDNSLLRTRNSNRFSFGLEFPSFGIDKGTGKMVFFRMGAEYNGSYMIIDSNPINYRAISFGAGIPVKGTLSAINLSLELGQNGTKKDGLFKENMFTLHLNLSLKDRWFMPRKYM